MEIENLLEKAKTGDKIALETLICKLSPIRKSICAKFPYLPRKDLEQDLILLLIEGIEKYQPGKSTFTWFVKQHSYYYALELTKQRKKELEMTQIKPKEGEIDPLETLTDGTTIEENYEKEVRNKDLIKAINTLEPIERYVIFFYYFRDYKIKEIARKLNLSPSTISKTKSKALRKLRISLHCLRP